MKAYDLGEHEAGPMPQRLEFGPAGDEISLESWLCAWHLNRAIRRDSLPTDDERAAAFEVRMDLARRLFADRGYS